MVSKNINYNCELKGAESHLQKIINDNQCCTACHHMQQYQHREVRTFIKERKKKRCPHTYTVTLSCNVIKGAEYCAFLTEYDFLVKSEEYMP